MPRAPFTFRDLERECEIETGCHQLDDDSPRTLGARIRVPRELWGRPPYCGSAYGFLQQLRGEIMELGILELPELPLNKTNYTLAQRAPKEHGYSKNPYLTATCQMPHQDTPPYPTAFWLDAPRRFFATWVMSRRAAMRVHAEQTAHPRIELEALHRRIVPETLAAHRAILVNRSPGLVLIDNSDACALYHARTCLFDEVAKEPDYDSDAPSYAFNEVGLLEHIDHLDERRGQAHRDADDYAEVVRFLRLNT